MEAFHDSIKSATLKELKVICKEYNVKTYGTKEKLREKLIEKFIVETETTKEASVEEIPTPEEDPEVETDEIPGEENEEFSTSWKRTYLVKACEIRNISKCKYLI